MSVENIEVTMPGCDGVRKSWVAPKLDKVEMHTTSGVSAITIPQPECLVGDTGDPALDPGNPVCGIS